MVCAVKRITYAVALAAALALYAVVIVALYAQDHPASAPAPSIECHAVGATTPTDKFVIQYPTTFVHFCAPTSALTG